MSGEDVTQHAHCWHTETTVMLTYPAQATVVCCHCGERQARVVSDLDDAQHGPFLPTKSVIVRGRPSRA